MSRHIHSSPTAIAAALVLLSTACGSTVQAPAAPAGIVDAATIPTASLNNPAPASAPAAVPGSVGPSVGGTPAGPRPSAAPGQVGQAAAPGGAAAPAAPPGTTPTAPPAADAGEPARGVTPDSVTIGFEVYDTTADALGYEGISSGDYARVHEILLEWVAANGGYGGRTVDPVFYDANTYMTTPDAAAEAQCAFFTSDHEVFAVSTIWHGPSFQGCIADAGLPHVTTTGYGFLDRQALQETPRYFDVAGGAVDVNASVYVEGLMELGFFDPDAVVGLLRTDSPPARRATEEVLRPGLAAHGVDIDEEFVFGPIDNIDEYGAASSQVSAAVLRFRAAGVTHVIFQDPSSGVMLMLFAAAAESQAYTPRYGATGDSLAATQYDLGTLPERQAANTVGVGWNAFADVSASRARVPAGQQRCLDLLDAAGYEPADRNALGNALLICDQHFFHKAVFDSITGEPTPDSYVQAAEALGDISTAMVGASRFAPGRHFAPAQYQVFSWIPDCRCFDYVAPAHPYPA